MEQAALGQLLARKELMVLATGGGIVSEPLTFDLILQSFYTIWLKARPEEHMARVRGQGDLRPMADDRSAMAELRTILLSREPLYARASAVVDTVGLSAWMPPPRAWSMRWRRCCRAKRKCSRGGELAARPALSRYIPAMKLLVPPRRARRRQTDRRKSAVAPRAGPAVRQSCGVDLARTIFDFGAPGFWELVHTSSDASRSTPPRSTACRCGHHLLLRSSRTTWPQFRSSKRSCSEVRRRDCCRCFLHCSREEAARRGRQSRPGRATQDDLGARPGSTISTATISRRCRASRLPHVCDTGGRPRPTRAREIVRPFWRFSTVAMTGVITAA